MIGEKMRNLLSALLAASVIFATPIALAGDSAPDDDDDSAAVAAPDVVEDAEVVEDVDPTELVDLIVKSIEAGNWSVAVGALLLLLLYGYRRYGHRLKYDSKYVPWVAIGMAVLAEIGVSLKGDIPASKAIADGVMIALGSSGFWMLIQGKEEDPEDEE